MIDYLHNFHLIQANNRLSGFIVVNQHHLLAARAKQVITGDRPYHMLLFVQNGIGTETAFQKHFPHIIQIIREMEAYNVFRVADGLDRLCLVDEP